MTAGVTDNLPLVSSAPTGVQRVRELVLELAIRGRLLPQDRSDEHAQHLMDRIVAERLRYGWAEKPSLIGESVMLSYPLPAGWVEATFQEVALEISTGPFGSLIHQADYVAGGTPLVNPSHMIGNRIVVDPRVALPPNKVRELEAYRLRAGDLVMARRGEVGRVALVTDAEDGWLCGTGSFRLRFIADFSREYICLIFLCKSVRSYLAGAAVGTTMVNLNHGIVKRLPVAIPPLAEQHRIVAKVDELMALCDRLEAQQADAEAAHTQLVEALLASLTQARDAADFRASWQQLAEHFQALFTTEGSVDALKQAVIDYGTSGRLSGLHDLEAVPDGWTSARLGDVVTGSGAGWSPSCEGRPRIGDEWGVLKVSAVSWSTFRPDENKALPAHLEPRPELQVRAGDFLISRANTAELVARSVLVESAPPRLMLSDKIIRLRLSGACSARFVQLANSSTSARNYYAAIAGGTSSSMKNVSRPQILALPISLPPMQEQLRIVAKVEELIALCDRLKQGLATAGKHHEHLASVLVEQAIA